MLITEASLMRGVRKFIQKALIPQPEGWNDKWDEAWVQRNLFPAYLESLREIEKVELCFGFDLKKAARDYCEGKDV